MRTLFVSVLLLACTAPSLVFAANEPVYTLDVRYDAETRTLEGTFDLEFLAETSTVYFSLLANLEATRNPYPSPRQQDAVYPYGFEPARITILSVERITGDEIAPVSFRTLSMPPSWQTYSLEDTVLAVDLPDLHLEVSGAETTPLDAETRSPVTLRCYFITEAPRTTMGDQGVTDGILTWRFGWFPMLFPNQPRLEEQDGVIGYQDKESFPLVFPWALLSATISIPADSSLIMGADRVEESIDRSQTSDETGPATPDQATRSYQIVNDSPSRSLALTVGPGYRSYRLESTTDVEVHYRSYHESDARLIATLAVDILADYVSRYGAYPRASLTIVENPSPHGQAFAADGIVWLSSRFFTHHDLLFPGALDRVIEFVLAHEIAHQWVGLGTGIDLDAEAWLSEGLAQYLSVRYFEDRYGAFEPNVFAPQMPGIVGDFVRQQWGFFNLREHFIELPYLLATRAGFDEELIKATENVQFENVESVRLYDKGYLVARAIAAKTGDEAFERALTRAIIERRADLLDARGFQSLLEEESGQSLAEFFDFWVFGPGAADYAIRILDRTADHDVHTTRVVVTRDGGVPQPVIIEATMQSKGTVQQTWDGMEESAVLEFVTPSLVTQVAIDPEHYLPDIDRLNNHSPAKIVGAVNENILPLDAYVLAPNQSTGGITFSHLDRLRIMISQTKASASVKIERNHQLAVSTSFSAPQLTGHIRYTYTTYEQPETGSAASYWEAAYAFSVMGTRFLAEGRPETALTFTATHLPSMTASNTQSIMLRLSRHSVGQVELSTRHDIRISPGTYLIAAARIAASTGAAPQPLQFRVPELHSLFIVPSNHAAVMRIALELPSPTALPYSLFQLAMIDSIRSRLFVTAGAGWTTLDEFGTTSPSIEVGMEQNFELSTLGGLISLTAQIGIAAPVLGTGLTTLYGGISF